MAILLGSALIGVLVLLGTTPAMALSWSRPPFESRSWVVRSEGCRRDQVLSWMSTVGGFLIGLSVPAGAKGDDDRPVFCLRPESPQEKAGLALYDVVIGNPPRTVVAIQRIAVPNDKNRNLQPGLVLKDFSNAQAVKDRIQTGPYPIQLEFVSLLDNEAIAMDSQDALAMAQKQSGPISAGNDNMDDTYSTRVVQQAPLDRCSIRSRRDDVLEIIYSAHLGTGPTGVLYDSSSFRGTGRPYQMVLGSGDMIPGVDQGLYDMCPGEIRQLSIPPPLAYGGKGNRLFRIPPNTPLFWEVELVSVIGRTPPDEEY